MGKILLTKNEFNSALINFTCDLLENTELNKILENVIDNKDYKKAGVELLILYMLMHLTAPNMLKYMENANKTNVPGLPPIPTHTWRISAKVLYRTGMYCLFDRGTLA